MRKVLHVVAEPRGKRTVLIIVVHCRQVAPGLVVAQPLPSARFKVDTEPLPAEKEQAEARWAVIGSQAGPKSRRREKQGDETGLEEHAVRLIASEILRRCDERKEADEADRKRRSRPEIHHDKN